MKPASGIGSCLNRREVRVLSATAGMSAALAAQGFALDGASTTSEYTGDTHTANHSKMLSASSMKAAGYLETEDCARIYYEDHGKSKPIILVHGWLCSSQFWQRTYCNSRQHTV